MKCSIKGCEGATVGQGLCRKHYQRLRIHGHTESTRPDGYGAKHKHPMWSSWKTFRRSDTKTNLCPEWYDDFWKFAKDVGDRPSKKHKLFTADESIDLGPDNFVWKEAITQRVDGEDDKTINARRSRVYRAVDKERYRLGDQKKHYKKKYGITLNKYNDMLSAQGGVCAICSQPETRMLRGKVAALSVDHCHTTGKVRGLLCNRCNIGLQMFKDNAELIQKASEYLNTVTPLYRLET
jgi:hypothetical protein